MSLYENIILHTRYLYVKKHRSFTHGINHIHDTHYMVLLSAPPIRSIYADSYSVYPLHFHYSPLRVDGSES